jgi:hypothetical protein
MTVSSIKSGKREGGRLLVKKIVQGLQHQDPKLQDHVITLRPAVLLRSSGFVFITSSMLARIDARLLGSSSHADRLPRRSGSFMLLGVCRTRLRSFGGRLMGSP